MRITHAANGLKPLEMQINETECTTDSVVTQYFSTFVLIGGTPLKYFITRDTLLNK